jgi:hypothetical protein
MSGESVKDYGRQIFNSLESHKKDFKQNYDSAKPFLDKFEQLGYKISISPNPKET